MFALSLNPSEGSQSRVPSAVSVISIPSPLALSRRPPTVHREGRAVDERSLGGAEEGGNLGHLLRLYEALYRGLGEHDLLDHLFLGDPVHTGLVGDLVLHQRRAHVGGADAVGGHSFGSALQRYNLRESLEAVLRRDVG